MMYEKLCSPHTWVRMIAIAKPNTNIGQISLPMILGTVCTATTPECRVTQTSSVNLQYLFRCRLVNVRLPAL